MRTLLIFILALSIHLIYAAEKNKEPVSFIEKIRPTFEKLIGKDTTDRWLGKAPEAVVEDKVAMPLIPKVVENAKSIEVYNKKADKVILAPELEQKFYIAFIKEIIESTRKQKATEEEIGNYYNVLMQGGTREGVYRAMVLDGTYAGLENVESVALNTNAIDFAVIFLEKYTGNKYSKDQFAGWNGFTLKRIVSEKALEIIDSFGENREGIEAWYANLSSDLAVKFPNQMKNNLRKTTSATSHLNWAKKVPVQHIKSEVMIKLHAAFNSMI